MAPTFFLEEIAGAGRSKRKMTVASSQWYPMSDSRIDLAETRQTPRLRPRPSRRPLVIEQPLSSPSPSSSAAAVVTMEVNNEDQRSSSFCRIALKGNRNDNTTTSNQLSMPIKKLPIPGKRPIHWNLANSDSNAAIQPRKIIFSTTSSSASHHLLAGCNSPSSLAVYSYAIVNQKLSHVGAFVPSRGSLHPNASIAYRFIFTNSL